MSCEFCTISPEEERLRIAETTHWKVYLAVQQGYLGQCILVLNRHCGDLADLTDEEWLDFSRLVKRLEVTVRSVFEATMFNWACLMNNAYKSAPPNPHVHWHMRPRYDHPVDFDGIQFQDGEFAHHYDNRKSPVVPAPTLQALAAALREHLR